MCDITVFWASVQQDVDYNQNYFFLLSVSEARIQNVTPALKV